MNHWIDVLIQRVSPEVATTLLAMFPVSELRASIPLALAWGFSPWEALLFSWLGNAVPLFLILYFFPFFVRAVIFLLPRSRKYLETYFVRLEVKHRKQYKRYGPFALLLFVAIPLPGSGVWTATIMAVLMRLPKRVVIPSVLGGMIIAGFLVAGITLGFIHVL